MGELLVQSHKGLWDCKGSVLTGHQEGAREPVAGWVLSPTCVIANVDLKLSRWNLLSRRAAVSRNPEAVEGWGTCRFLGYHVAH